MMRPKSAMFYINDIEAISCDLSDLILQSMDDNQEVDDLLELINRWSLESITAIFLDIFYLFRSKSYNEKWLIMKNSGLL